MDDSDDKRNNSPDSGAGRPGEEATPTSGTEEISTSATPPDPTEQSTPPDPEPTDDRQRAEPDAGSPSPAGEAHNQIEMPDSNGTAPAEGSQQAGPEAVSPAQGEAPSDKTEKAATSAPLGATALSTAGNMQEASANERLAWLLTQIPQWKGEGLVSPEQATGLEQSCRAQSHEHDTPQELIEKPLAPMAIFGALIVGLAIGILTGANPTSEAWGAELSFALALILLPMALMIWTLRPNQLPPTLYFLREPAIITATISLWCALSIIFDLIRIIPNISIGIEWGTFLLVSTGLLTQFLLMLKTRSHTLPFLFAVILFGVSLSWSEPPRPEVYRFVPPTLKVITAWLAIAAYLLFAKFQLASLAQARPRLSVMYLWSLLLVLLAGLFLPVTGSDPNIVLFLGSLLYAALLGIGRTLFIHYSESFEYQYRYRPFELLGAFGILFSTAYLAFLESPHHAAQALTSLTPAEYLSYIPPHIYLIAAALLPLWLAALYMQAARKDYSALPLLIFPLITLAANILWLSAPNPEVVQWLFTYYLVLGLALWMVITGIDTFQHQILNTGLIILLAAILRAFVDSDTLTNALLNTALFTTTALAMLPFLYRQTRLMKRHPAP